MRDKISLINKKFGNRTVVAFSHIDTKGMSKWRCICDCGKLSILRKENLYRDKSCPNCSRTKHGFTKNKSKGLGTAYKSWCAMKQRCLNSNSHNYYLYGGRGIKIHQLWVDSFVEFYKYIGDRPKGTSLDRIDSNGNYEPGNVRWADNKTQRNNRRGNNHATRTA